MAPKFRPPFKRKPETDVPTVPNAGQSSSHKKKKTKSEDNKNVKTDTKSTKPKVAESMADRSDPNKFVFSVANGRQSSVNIIKAIKMSKKFGVCDGKELEEVEFEDNQLVPQIKVNDVDDQATDAISVPEITPQVKVNLNDIVWSDFEDDDDFFDRD